MATNAKIGVYCGRLSKVIKVRSGGHRTASHRQSSETAAHQWISWSVAFASGISPPIFQTLRMPRSSSHSRWPRLARSLVWILQFSIWTSTTVPDRNPRRVAPLGSEHTQSTFTQVVKRSVLNPARGEENETTVGFSGCFGITSGTPGSRATRRGAGAESAARQPGPHSATASHEGQSALRARTRAT